MHDEERMEDGKFENKTVSEKVEDSINTISFTDKNITLSTISSTQANLTKPVSKEISNVHITEI